MSHPADHNDYCDWHLDQYDFECNCGVIVICPFCNGTGTGNNPLNDPELCQECNGRGMINTRSVD